MPDRPGLDICGSVPDTCVDMPRLPSSDPAARSARQRRVVTILALLLIIAGAVILAALPRVPPPLRITAGLMDVFIGLILLVLVRQNAGK